MSYPDFSSVAGLSLVGNAAQENSYLRLTQDSTSKVGAAWYETRFPISRGFETTFTYFIGGSSSTGADGMAFVVQNSHPATIGQFGGGLAYAGIGSSLAVEFDTHQNSEINDPDGNHISIQSRGAEPNSQNHAYSSGTTSAVPELRGQHVVKVAYAVPGDVPCDTGTFSVFIDNLTSPVLSASLNICDLTQQNETQPDDDSAWIGFTAATGGQRDAHRVLSWNASGLLAENRPPNFDNLPNQVVEVEKELTFMVSASDPDGELLTYSASDQPEGATFDPSSQTWSWTPELGDEGFYSPSFTATDPSGLSSTMTVSVTVAHTPSRVFRAPYSRECNVRTNQVGAHAFASARSDRESGSSNIDVTADLGTTSGELPPLPDQVADAEAGLGATYIASRTGTVRVTASYLVSGGEQVAQAVELFGSGEVANVIFLEVIRANSPPVVIRDESAVPGVSPALLPYGSRQFTNLRVSLTAEFHLDPATVPQLLLCASTKTSASTVGFAYADAHWLISLDEIRIEALS